MTYLETVWTVIAAVITVAGLVIAFARVSPTDAKTNLASWVEASGYHKIAAWLKLESTQGTLGRIGASATLAGGIGLGAAILPQLPERIFGKDEAGLQSQVDEVLKRRDQSVAALAVARMEASLPPRTGFLSITDADRWKYATEIRFQTANAGNGKPCEARLFAKPSDTSSDGLSKEIPRLLDMGSWHTEGGRNAKNVFPDGITINVSGDNGPSFNCGYRLSEVLENMKIRPVNLRANVTTPDLVQCKECVEVIFGTTKKPEG